MNYAMHAEIVDCQKCSTKNYDEERVNNLFSWRSVKTLHHAITSSSFNIGSYPRRELQASVDAVRRVEGRGSHSLPLRLPPIFVLFAEVGAGRKTTKVDIKELTHQKQEFWKVQPAALILIHLFEYAYVLIVHSALIEVDSNR